MKELNKLLQLANNVEIPEKVKTTVSNSKPSFGIVNSHNGKRLTFSKALTQKLGLESTADISPIPSEGCVLIAPKLPVSSALTATLKDDDGRKISYTAAPVQALTQIFGLNFTEHSSMSFQDITFEALDDTPVAIVKIFNKYPQN